MKKALVSIAVVLLLQSGSLLADTLMVEKVRSEAASGAARPDRGLSKQQVAAHFGEPAERLPAVGEPAISRWIYDSYTVYFEGDRVIHAVVRR